MKEREAARKSNEEDPSKQQFKENTHSFSWLRQQMMAKEIQKKNLVTRQPS